MDSKLGCRSNEWPVSSSAASTKLRRLHARANRVSIVPTIVERQCFCLLFFVDIGFWDKTWSINSGEHVYRDQKIRVHKRILRPKAGVLSPKYLAKSHFCTWKSKLRRSSATKLKHLRLKPARNYSLTAETSVFSWSRNRGEHDWEIENVSHMLFQSWNLKAPEAGERLVNDSIALQHDRVAGPPRQYNLATA